MPLSPEQREQLRADTFAAYQQYLNSGLASLLKFMGLDVVEDHAQGASVWDLDGNQYLDCLGGYGALSLGHRHPRVVAAVQEQLAKMPMSAKIMLSRPLAQAARALAEVTPGDLTCSFWCNSGAEAVEGALKLARLYTGRARIVAALGAFHGKTLGGLSASGRELFRQPFQPLVPGFAHVPFGDAQALEQAVDEGTAAVILEPIQGEAGVILPPPGYLARARELCDRHRALLILDEVQTGLGRTGRLFACEHEGVVPDIMTLAKALGGGVMPVGAFIATPQVWKVMEPNPLLHSSTFGGNPLACAAAYAAIRVAVEEELPARAAKLGSHALSRLQEVAARQPGMISEVRGRGLLIGISLAHEDIAGLVIAGLVQRRILAAYTLNNPTVIRIEPPLVIAPADLDRAIAALEESLAQTAELLGDLPADTA